MSHRPRHRSAFIAWISLAFGLVVSAVPEVHGQEKRGPLPVAAVEREGPVDFEREVLPILRANCLACHNKSEAKGDLSVETPQTLRTGGEEGPAIVPGKAEESLLFLLAAHREKPRMPPRKNDVGAKPLSPKQLGLLELWIDQGAKGKVTRRSEPVRWQALAPRVHPIYAVAMSPDGQFAACGRANQVFVYHVPSGKELDRLIDPELADSKLYRKTGAPHLSMVQSLTFSPDGQTIASGGYRTAKLWRRQARQKITHWPATEGRVTAMALSPDGKLCGLGQASGVIELVDSSRGQRIRSLKGHSGPIAGLEFSADGTKLYSGSADKSLRTWNVDDGSSLGQLDHTVAVTALGLVSGGSQIATGGEDHTMRIWPLPEAPHPEGTESAEAAGSSTQPIGELEGHSAAITSLAVVDDEGTQTITGSLDGTLRHWNLKDGQQIREFRHGGPVTGVAARPDGQRFASVSENKTGKLWNAKDGQQVAELKGDFRVRLEVDGLARKVEAAKQHVEASQRAVQRAEGDLKRKTDDIQKAIDRKKRIDKELAGLITKAEKPAAEKAAADKAVADQKIAVEKAAKVAAEKATPEARNELAQQQKKLEQFEKFAKTADEAHVKAQRAVARHQGWASDAIIFIPAAKAAAGTATNTLTKCMVTFEAAEKDARQAEADLAAGANRTAESETPYRAVAYSHDGQQLALAGDDGKIQLYDAESGAATDTLDAATAKVSAVGFTPSGELLAAADKSVSRWDLNLRWKLERTIGDPNDGSFISDRVTALTFSPDGKILATGGGEPSRGGELKLWNVADGALVREVSDAHSDTIFGLDFSPRGDRIVSGSADHFVKMFRVADGSFLKSFEGHTHHVLGVSWKLDGRRIVSCGADKAVKIWDIEDDTKKRSINAHKKEVTTIAYIGFTDQFLTCSADMQVGLYRSEDGRTIRHFQGATDFLYSAAASDDGKYIIAGGQDGVLRVWDGKNGKALYQFAPGAKSE